MSIIICELSSQQGDATAARLHHCGNEIRALVHGTKTSLGEYLNQECLVEMAFKRLVRWRELPEFDDAQSCIQQNSEVPGAITVRGRVHSATEVAENVQIIDLYLQAGPEFLAISSEELGGYAPSIGTGLEVTVHGLCFYPTGT